jgi:gluconolactonase
MKHGAAIMPDALRWLWRPDPIVVKEPAAFEKEGWDPRGKVYSTVWASKGWERVDGPNAPAADAGKTVTGARYAVEKKAVVLRDASGKRRVVYRGTDLAQPSGVALSPDQAMLVVTDAQSRFSWSFQIAPDGSLRNGEPFYRLEMPESGWMSGVQGAVFDSIGQVYFATPLGVQVCEANGRVAMILNPPERGPVTSVAFGGDERNWLYVTVNGKTYRREAKVKGVPPSQVAKLPRPPL